MAGKKKYELVADNYHEVTSKPNEPFTYKPYVKGDTIELDAEQAERLLAAGAVQEPDAEPARSTRGAQTKAPKGKADGVGDGDADAGTIGDGGPDPQATGSTSTSEQTAGPGDGQGSGDESASQGAAKRS
jgi:hypothetical protein